MNYVFGGLVREFEYKNVKPTQKVLDKLEDMTDILVDFEEPSGDSAEIDSIDYDVKPEACEIYVKCPELVIKTPEDRALLEAIEMADKFEFKRIVEYDEGDGILLTLTVNM